MMSFAADPRSFEMAPQPRPAWGTLASVGLHMVLLALLLLVPGMPPVDAPAVQAVAVDLVSAAQFAALLATTAPAPTAPVPELTPAPKVEAAPQSGPIRATEFFSGSLLAEPESAGLRRALTTVADGERLVQLCDIEAQEQIRRARPEYDPDMVVAYAMAETVVRDGALVATGAAFRSRREWYELEFTCSTAPDFSGVTGFEFSVGDLIPHDEWDAHYLTAEEVDD